MLFLYSTFIIQYSSFSQQDAQYSQYMFNQMAFNPGYVASRNVLSSAFIIRNQWVGIEGAPSTATLTLQVPVPKKKNGWGLMLMSDEIGPKKTIAFSGTYVYRIQVEGGRLAFGLRYGAYNYIIDWSKVSYQERADVLNTGLRNQILIPTADFGLYYNTLKWFVGASCTHMLAGTLNKYRSDFAKAMQLETHYFFNAGYGFKINDNLLFNPTLLIKTTAHTKPIIDLNNNFFINQVLWLGITARSNKDIIIITRYNISDKFKIGYAYDTGFNQISLQSKGTHELLLQYDVNIAKQKHFSPRYF